MANKRWARKYKKKMGREMDSCLCGCKIKEQESKDFNDNESKGKEVNMNFQVKRTFLRQMKA